MKKPVEQRTHKRRVEALRSSNERSARTTSHPFKAARRVGAEARAAAWAAMSVEEQLTELRARPGECKRQIERLLNPKQKKVIEAAAAEAETAPGSKTPPKEDRKATRAFKKKQKQIAKATHSAEQE